MILLTVSIKSIQLFTRYLWTKQTNEQAQTWVKTLLPFHIQGQTLLCINMKLWSNNFFQKRLTQLFSTDTALIGSSVPLRQVWLFHASLEGLNLDCNFVSESTGSSSMVCPMASRPSLFMRRSRGPDSLGRAVPCSTGDSPEIIAGTRLFRNSIFSRKF